MGYQRTWEGVVSSLVAVSRLSASERRDVRTQDCHGDDRYNHLAVLNPSPHSDPHVKDRRLRKFHRVVLAGQHKCNPCEDSGQGTGHSVCGCPCV